MPAIVNEENKKAKPFRLALDAATVNKAEPTAYNGKTHNIGISL